MNRPPVQTPEAAWSVYQARLAEQCSEKHLEHLSAEKLNELARDTYKEDGSQAQQIIDQYTHRACGKTGGAECYNTGFIQAVVLTGSVSQFVKTVCSKGPEAEPKTGEAKAGE
jgi:hypothetical protein